MQFRGNHQQQPSTFDDLDALSEDDRDAPGHRVQPTQRQRKNQIGWVLGILALVVLTLMSFLPAPYVIQRAGPVYDTLGTVTLTEDEEEIEREVITVSGRETYPTEGQLFMTTVSVVGNREQPPGWLEIFSSWLSKTERVLPVDEVFPANVTVEQQRQVNEAQMTASQGEAVAAALTYLGEDFTQELYVQQVVTEAPAAGTIEVGDRITQVGTIVLGNVDQLREAAADVGVGGTLALTIERDGQENQIEVQTMAADDGTPVVGLGISAEYDFPVDVEIQLGNVGGPSAGMIFSLGIIDLLTPGSLIGDNSVAGTGTITPEGQVGSIGGIQQKMVGAVSSGAEWFLAPESNCSEVAGHVPDGLEVISVATLSDAVEAAESIESGTGVDELARCE